MSGNFDRALRHLAELSAISRLSDYDSSIRELVMQVVAVADPLSLKTAKDIQTATDVFFGIPLELALISKALESLILEDRIRVELGSLSLAAKEQANRGELISNSQKQETAVYQNWQNEIVADGTLSDVSFEELKKCMAEYLGLAFRQHGIETAQMLDASSALGKIETESLVHVLNSTINRNFSAEKRATVRLLMTTFFRNTDKFPERKKHLIELADGAFSFFTFFIDPTVSSRLREKLTKLEFYLDTNYLWGLLGLHDNQYVEASVEFFSLAKRLNLPFTFKYHKVTESELLRSVASASDSLRQKIWKASISETLKNSPYISGIERKFHERNSANKADVSMFLKPYENISRMVQEQDIKIDNREIEWGESVNTLFHEYDDYLKTVEKEKSYEAMQHDTRLLWLAQSMRSNSQSPLQAGTLLLTCDSRLYNFDVHNSRKHRRWPTTILPNVLLQILRPAIKQTDDFDTMFVKTFSLPEFRSYNKKSSQAVQTMAEILSAVEGLKPALVEQLLLDDILVKDVAHAKTSQEVVDRLNSAITAKVAVIESELNNIRTELQSEKSVNALLEQSGVEHRREIDELKTISTQLAEGSASRAIIENNLDEEKKKRLKAEEEIAKVRDEYDKQKKFIHGLRCIGVLLLFCFGAFVLCWGAWYLDWITKFSKLTSMFLGIVFFAATALFKNHKEWAIGLFTAGVGCILAFFA